MPLQINLTLQVPALPDNDIWFANAAAWSNYWKNVPVVSTIQPVVTETYTSLPYNTNLPPLQMNYNSVAYTFPTLSMFDSLRQQLDNLEANLINFIQELKDGGLVTSAAEYVSQPYDENLVPAAFNVNGTDYVVSTLTMFDSLRNQLAAVDAGYQNLRAQLQNNGLITS